MSNFPNQQYVQEQNVLSESTVEKNNQNNQNNMNNQNIPFDRNQNNSDSDDRPFDNEEGSLQNDKKIDESTNVNTLIKPENDLEKFKQKISPDFKNDINGILIRIFLLIM